MRKLTLMAIIVVACAGNAWPQQPKGPLTVKGLEGEIESLRAPKVAWREVPWKSCLLDGLRESRAQNKPCLLWVFIDRPIDDARC
jgi:hypothetical protein